MRLAIVTHNVLRGDGQGRVNYEVARAALADGVDVTLIADAIDEDLVDLGARWIPIQPTFHDVILFKVREFAWRANRLLARMEGEFDVVCGNGYVLTRPHHVNAAHFVHSAWLDSPAHPRRTLSGIRKIYQGIYTRANVGWERQAFRNANRIIAVSSIVRDQLVEIGVDARRIQVISNGVDLDEFTPASVDRRALGLPSGVPLAFFAGDVRTQRKNVGTILETLPSVPELHLAVAGSLDGSPFPELAKQLGVEERVHFLGFRRDLPDLMRAADVFILLSFYEPFGLVVLEALASGTPVIAARSVGASDCIDDTCGRVIESNTDTRALKEAIESILTFDADASVRAREAASRHGWKQMADAYLDVFRNVSRREES